MRIFDFSSYQAFLAAYLESQPKKGYGILRLWAQKLGISNTLISQIVSGKRDLNLEIAMGLTEILELTGKEKDYFVLLVELNRAGTAKLREYFKTKVSEAQLAARMLKNRIENVAELSDHAKAHYYASWVYSAIRVTLSTAPRITRTELAERLGISLARTQEALEFLERHGMIASEKNKWTVEEKSFYLSSDSPLVIKHHQNWRIKSIQSMDDKNEEDLFFTSPMSLSEAVATKIRKDIVDLIQEVRKKAGDSDPEAARCLNIDWFKI